MSPSLERILDPSRRSLDHLIGALTPGSASEKRWIRDQIKEIGLPWLENLAHTAAEARLRSYSPYSHYAVGAAALDIQGNKHDGQNIEIVSYTDTEHAEEMAVKKAVSAGAVQKMGRTFVRAVAVSHEGDTSPCGRCRQIIAEFADNALIVVADPEGEIRRITSLEILLPHAFTPKDLGIK